MFDESVPVADIQAALDAVRTDQFSTERYAFLFAPGTYPVDARLGYYTTIAGLGRSPSDTTITGAVRVEGYPDPTVASGISALENFWRSAENLTVAPAGGVSRWAVSQAAPLRRVHVRGDLVLEPGGGGYSSGGYLADSRVDGVVVNGSQQQWITRDSELRGGWTDGGWNQVFCGVTGDVPAERMPYTVLATSPVTREKPFLYTGDAGAYRVFLPALRHDTSGTTWSAGADPAGTSLAVEDFHVAKPSDGAARINEALAAGRHLLLTPGVYHLDEPLAVTRPGTVVLGLGLPTLTPDRGTAALLVADVDGVRLAGFLVDAGPVESPVLVEIGDAGVHRDHAADPTTVQDVFFRIGGPWAGAATTTLVIHADDTIVDNVWAWRADHGEGVGWTVNPADSGVIVNGDDVTAYGLFVEHYQKWQTIWRGERGRTIFYQSEMPYDPPSPAAWTGPTGAGWASYKVDAATHEAWGLGVYCYFNQGVDIRAARAIEVPAAGVVLHRATSVFLNGGGGIEATVNDAGTPTVGAFGLSTVEAYP